MGVNEGIYRLTVDVGVRIIKQVERVITWGSKVGNPAFFTPDQFSWVQPLEANWSVIRRELDAMLKFRETLPNFQDISTDQRALTTDDHWKTLFFYAYGIKAEGNCKRCPETTRLVEAVPGMTTALFSIISAGKHIPAHRGPFKGVLRYHLGLLVPEPRDRCRIRVGTEVRHWEEGRSLVFDDTYEHEVWNDTEGLRAVLFLDVVRPLRFPASIINRCILFLIAHSPFVKDGVQNYKAWEQKLDAVMNAGSRVPPGTAL